LSIYNRFIISFLDCAASSLSPTSNQSTFVDPLIPKEYTLDLTAVLKIKTLPTYTSRRSRERVVTWHYKEANTAYIIDHFPRMA